MIILLTPFFPPNTGGVEIHLADYINFLAKKRIKATVLTYQPITTPVNAPFKEKRGNVAIYRFPYLAFNLFYKLAPYPPLQFIYLFFGLFLYAFFFLLFNSSKVKVIHSHGLAAGLVSGLFGKIFHKRSVLSLHTIYKFSLRPQTAGLAKKIFGLNDHILAIAQGCKDDLVKIGVPEKKVAAYSYWVNTEKFRPLSQDKCRQELGLPGDKFIALFVGRFNPEKQVKEALRAASLSPRTLTLFVGEGPLQQEIKNYQSKFPNIKLIGRVDNQQIPFYYNAADLLLLGPVDEDYFGKVSMEAMASGLPILVTNQSYYFGKLKEVNPSILPSGCGFMVDLNPEVIGAALSQLVGERKKLKRMHLSCRRFALRHFGSRNATIILQAYE